MSESEFAQSFGRTTREVVAELWADQHYSPGQIAEINATKEAIFRRRMVHNFPAMKGIQALLDALHSAGFQLGIGSSAPPENVEQVLQGLNRKHIFGAVVTGADVVKGKPHPEVFLQGARKLGIPPDRCVVIDDAPAGVEAANAAGTQSIGFASTGRSPEQLLHARYVISCLTELNVERLRGIIDTACLKNNRK